MKAAGMVMDALDIETFVACSSEDEAKRLMRELMAGMGLSETDIVFVDVAGPGARVRARAYIHRPGDSYGWLGGDRSGDGGRSRSA